MKKLFTLLFISIAFISQQASAQIKKGEKMLGANIGLSTATNKESNSPDYKGSSTSISIIPQLGFGVGNNWIIGLEAGYTFFKHKNEFPVNDMNEQKRNTVLGGVFARKFFPMGERFGLFGQGDLSYSHTKDRYKSTVGVGVDAKSKANSFVAAISPGAYFRTGKRFILEAEVGSLGYEHRTTKAEDGDNKATSNSFFLGLSNNLSIGFKVVL